MGDISYILFYLIVLGLLLFLSAFFSISEIALFSLSRTRIERLRQSKVKVDKFVAKLMDNPRRLLITILIGNTIVNSASASLVASFTTSVFGYSGVGIAIIISTVLIVMFGDIMPKTIAIHHNETISKIVAYPIDFFSKIISPLRRIFSSMTDSIIDFMSGDESEFKEKITQEDLKTMIDMAEEEGSIEKREKDIINAILDLRYITAAEVMVPRTDMICASDELTLQQVFDIGKKFRRSKIPVYKGDIDHIFGIAYIRDFQMWRHFNILSMTVAEFAKRQGKIWGRGANTLIRKPFFAPETRTGIGLLQDFKDKKTHIAIVLDEYGGTAGLVTMKDLLTELVGEFSDEHEQIADEFQIVDDWTTIVSGKASIRNVNKKLNLDLPTEGDIDTIGGYVISLFGRIPDVGEKISVNSVDFEVIKEDGRRITELLIKKHKNTEELG